MWLIIRLLKKLRILILIYFSNQYSVAKVYRKFFKVKIGSNVRFTGKPSWGSEPYLIEIGDNVTITQSVTFHTHDGGVGLFRKEFPGINVMGRIKIGNNVFIGSHTIFLPNVTVGDNVVIGAGSLVTKDIPANSVAAGVPAKVIRDIENYKIQALSKAIYLFSKNERNRKEEVLKQLKKQ